jgi:hypothetical protein
MKGAEPPSYYWPATLTKAAFPARGPEPPRLIAASFFLRFLRLFAAISASVLAPSLFCGYGFARPQLGCNLSFLYGNSGW